MSKKFRSKTRNEKKEKENNDNRTSDEREFIHQ